jgi:hypothetical protein
VLRKGNRRGEIMVNRNLNQVEPDSIDRLVSLFQRFKANVPKLEAGKSMPLHCYH